MQIQERQKCLHGDGRKRSSGIFCSCSINVSNVPIKCNILIWNAESFFFENTPAGRLLLAKTGTQTVLVDISLLAEFQHLGIGSALLKELQGEIKAGESLRLAVLKTNRARGLYERVGFQIHEVGELYLTMIWHRS
jgi:GNAT superfamily N-acetyltransferase